MQELTNLYEELGAKAEAIEGVKWVDLWHNQVNFLEDEFPFSTPAIFFKFFIINTADIGDKSQNVTWQVDVYLFYETMADTFRGSMNKESALGFLELLSAIHAVFHGSTGENYSSMRRIALGPEDTGDAGNLYKISFTCQSLDYGASRLYTDSTIADMNVVNEEAPETGANDTYFRIE